MTVRPMTEAQDSGDVERARVRNLPAAAAELLERAAAAPAGRAALSLVSGAGARSSRRCWRCGKARTWPNTTPLGQRRSRSCRAGCGW